MQQKIIAGTYDSDLVNVSPNEAIYVVTRDYVQQFMDYSQDEFGVFDVTAWEDSSLVQAWYSTIANIKNEIGQLTDLPDDISDDDAREAALTLKALKAILKSLNRYVDPQAAIEKANEMRFLDSKMKLLNS